MIISASIRQYKLENGMCKVVVYDKNTGVNGWAIQPTAEGAYQMAKASFIQEFHGFQCERTEVIEIGPQKE